MKTTTIAPWFGSNRMLAKHVGEELVGCSWVGVPFAGGMCELAYIEARTINVNDLHRHIINLATVMADETLGPKLYRALRRHPFHPEALAQAQEECRSREHLLSAGMAPIDKLTWAINYFVCAWMPRHGSSGTTGEFKVQQSVRWNSSGGDSAKHYRSAVEGIRAWRKVLHRANFTTLHYREFLEKCKDEDGHGLYCDPPFPGPGEKYAYTMTEPLHRLLASDLAMYRKARVVCRFYDVPLVRELYPNPDWHWRHLVGRKQTNAAAPEVLILNGPSIAGGN